MPKLPRAEQKTIYSPARMPNLVGDGYTAAARGEAAIGQATQQLGRGIGALGAGLEAAGQVDDKDDEFRAKMSLVNFTNKVTADDMTARQSFTGDMDPNGWAEKRMEFYRSESSRVMEGIRSPKARQMAAHYFAQHGGSYQRGAIQFEGQARISRLVSDTQASITGGFDMVDLRNFKSLPQEEQATRVAALEQQIKGAAAMARDMPGVSEAQRAAIWRHTSDLSIKKLEALPPDLRATIAERLQREWTAAEQAQTPQGAVSFDGIAPTGTPPETLKAVSSVAQTIGANPSAIAGVIDTESKWNPRAQTGSYMGLTQVGPVTLREMGVSVEQYRAMSQPEQAAFYGRWLQHYKFNEKMEAAGIDFKALPPARQAAVLQAFQFAPNGAWIERYGKGDTVTPVTNTKQARALGSTSIADMEAYYSKRLPQSGQGVTPGAKPENQGAQVAYKPPGTPGVVAAITDQTERKFTPQGYGERVTGKITVNGRTYEFVNGGTGRGSIPLGEYEIKRFTSGSQRAREGFSYRKDAFELSDVAGDAPATKGKDDRRGLLIHDGNRGVTAGCIGIKGDFEQFKADLAAEMQKNGGNLKLQLGTPDRFKGAASTAIASTNQDELGPDPEGATRVAGDVTRRAPPMRAGPMSEIIEGIQKRMPQWKNEQLRAVDAMVKQAEASALEGYDLPESTFASIQQSVEATGDAGLMQRMKIATLKAAAVRGRGQMPPDQLNTLARNARLRLGTTATPEQLASVEALEALAKKVSTSVEKDPIAHYGKAFKVDVPALDPVRMNEAQLRDRLVLAQTIAQRNNRPLRVLTEAEQKAFTDYAMRGGKEALGMLRTIYDVAGPNTATITKEFSKHSTEVAALGWLISSKVDSKTINDLGEAMQLRQSEKFKSVAPPHEVTRGWAQAELGAAFMESPKAAELAIRMANNLYEVRARRENLGGGAATNTEKWKEGLREVIGQNKSTDGKITYGGIARQSSGWFGSHSVLVPPTMRPDKLPDVMKSLTVEDLLTPGAVPEGTQLMTSEDVQSGAVTAARNQQQTVPLEGEVPKIGEGWKESPLAGSPKESKQDKADRIKAANPGDQTEFDLIRQQFNYGLPIDKHGRQVPMAIVKTSKLVAIGDGKYWLSPNAGEYLKRIAINPRTGEMTTVNVVLDLNSQKLKDRVPEAYRPD